MSFISAWTRSWRLAWGSSKAGTQTSSTASAGRIASKFLTFEDIRADFGDLYTTDPHLYRSAITAGGRLFVEGQNQIKIRDTDFGRGKILRYFLIR